MLYPRSTSIISLCDSYYLYGNTYQEPNLISENFSSAPQLPTSLGAIGANGFRVFEGRTLFCPWWPWSRFFCCPTSASAFSNFFWLQLIQLSLEPNPWIFRLGQFIQPHCHRCLTFAIINKSTIVSGLMVIIGAVWMMVLCSDPATTSSLLS